MRVKHQRSMFIYSYALIFMLFLNLSCEYQHPQEEVEGYIEHIMVDIPLDINDSTYNLELYPFDVRVMIKNATSDTLKLNFKTSIKKVATYDLIAFTERDTLFFCAYNDGEEIIQPFSEKSISFFNEAPSFMMFRKRYKNANNYIYKSALSDFVLTSDFQLITPTDTITINRNKRTSISFKDILIQFGNMKFEPSI